MEKVEGEGRKEKERIGTRHGRDKKEEDRDGTERVRAGREG